MLNLEKLRRETPACERILHFNNAGSSLNPWVVSDAVLRHLQREQEIGGYEAAAEAEQAQQLFYTAMGKYLGCAADEIAFAESASRAWTLALFSVPFQAGDEVITFPSEYASNYMSLLHLARQKNLIVKVCPFNESGQVDLIALESMISSKTRVIALTHVASQRGDIQPAAAVGKLAREHSIYYLLDACQSAGQLALDVSTLGCHFLAGTGRKYLRGPRGTGFLYVDAEIVEQLTPSFADLHSAQWLSTESFAWQAGARRFESFERHLAGMIGLGAAVNYANNIGIQHIEKRVQELASDLRDRLSQLDPIQVHERAEECSGIVTFSSSKESAAELKQRLNELGVNVSVSKSENAQLDLAREGVAAVVRASVHYYNSDEEITRFLDLVASV